MDNIDEKINQILRITRYVFEDESKLNGLLEDVTDGLGYEFYLKLKNEYLDKSYFGMYRQYLYYILTDGEQGVKPDDM